MKLVIVESPAKSKTIKNYLGKGYVVKASVGHVRDLPKKNEGAIDIEKGFVPNYIDIDLKKPVIAEIKKAASSADEVLLATDPDREGEAIAWHVSIAAGIKNPKRIVFHEITEKAVKEALKHPRKIDTHLRRAQEARRVLDRLFGYGLSGLIWKKLRYGLSAGRVQSPALRILVERERLIREFIPEDYWVIYADVTSEKGEKFQLTCTEEPREKTREEEILKLGKSALWSVEKVEEKNWTRHPRPAFTTSTLQQTASSRYGFTPARTMRLAQGLYEQGHITYMRTDSVTLSQDARTELTEIIKKIYGNEYSEPRQYKTRSKSAQEAHEAIRPTHANKDALGATEDHKKLYQLIRNRALASQMAGAKLLKTKITAKANDEQVPLFSANGSRMLFDGWLRADKASAGEDVELPKVAQGENLGLILLQSEAKQTQPPQRYTEAGLVKELEKRGIGRPSTYASTIKTVQDREYAEKEGKALKATELGEVVIDFLEKNFASYISDDFTSEMEDELDEIALGKREYEKTLRDFYTPFNKDIKSKKDIPRLTDLAPAPDEFRCPKCNAEMVFKLGKSGKFMSCSTFPKCDGIRSTEGEAIEGKRETGEVCPECKKAPLIERNGKFGRFIACSRYPKCKFVKRDEGALLANSTGVKCTECKQGEMVPKKGKYGQFYSCSNYPKCKFTTNAKPTGDKCNKCGSLIMEGTKTIPIRCSNKKCENHNPHKTKK